MRIASPAFHDHGDMPAQHTCEGADVSPPLALHVDVAGARTLALVVEDPDAASGAPFVHWIVYNLPATTTALVEGVRAQALPPGTRLGSNSRGGTAWIGPCPTRGRHRCVFTLYALEAMLPNLGAPTREVLVRAMRGHVLARAELVGTCKLGSAAAAPP